MPRNAQWTATEDQQLTQLTLQNSRENNGNLDWDCIHDLRRGQIERRSKNAMISRWWKIKEQLNFDVMDDINYDDNSSSKTEDDIPKRKRRKKKKMENIIHSILRTNDNDSWTQSEEEEEEGDMISYKNYYSHDIETLKLTSFDITLLKPYIHAFEEQILMANICGNNTQKENDNLRKTIIIQNKFLTQLYTKIQHQQGIVREMVECSEKLKFKINYMNERNKEIDHIFNKQILIKDKDIDDLKNKLDILKNKLDTKQLMDNINLVSNNNDFNQIIELMHTLSDIVELETNHNNVNQFIANLKCKLYDILDKTEYGNNIKRNKRKLNSNSNSNNINPRKKRKKTDGKQLSLPTINGNNNRVQPVLFTPSMTAEYQRILPPSLSAHVPPPLPPQPPPNTNKYGIDLLLKVAMLDHQNN